jgi:hypothetical protein
MSLFAVAASRGARTFGVAAGVSQARIAAPTVVTVQPKLMMMSSVADRDNILPVSIFVSFCYNWEEYYIMHIPHWGLIMIIILTQSRIHFRPDPFNFPLSRRLPTPSSSH